MDAKSVIASTERGLSRIVEAVQHIEAAKERLLLDIQDATLCLTRELGPFLPLSEEDDRQLYVVAKRIAELHNRAFPESPVEGE